jgi:hypothetical protein
MPSAISGLEENAGTQMYVIQHTAELSIDEFHSPFLGTLDPNKRWVLLHKVIPRMALESYYAPQFTARTVAQASLNGIRSGVHPAMIEDDQSGDSGADHGITRHASFHWVERLPETAAVCPICPTTNWIDALRQPWAGSLPH